MDPVPDTIAFRLERVPVALNDLHLSPVIGLGAVSFGQLHPERQAGSGPDHIALMAIAVPYESGLVGAIALGIGFLALLWTLVRFAITAGHGGNHPSAGMAAAYVGSIVAFLVAYQSNNALHLAINWMVMGAGAALVAGTAPPTSSRDGHGSPTT